MADAALRGEVRLGHVRLLVGAARAKPHRWAALADVEELATRTAAEVSEPRFARFVERWAALVDAEHDASLRAQGIDVPVMDHGAAEQAERRELFLSRYGADGMWALSGTLDTETGLALSMALESVSEAIRGEDRDRDLAHLRHDALGVLLSGQLSAGLPVHKGVRPHIMVITRDGDAPPCPIGHGPDQRDLAAPSHAELLDRTDGTVGGLWLSGLARQRLACDAVTQSPDRRRRRGPAAARAIRARRTPGAAQGHRHPRPALRVRRMLRSRDVVPGPPHRSTGRTGVLPTNGTSSWSASSITGPSTNADSNSGGRPTATTSRPSDPTDP